MNWMRESSVYKAIFEEGRAHGWEEARARVGLQAERVEARILEAELETLRWVLLGVGTDKFGPPDAATASRIEQIGAPGTLHWVIRDVPRADSWQEVRGLMIPF